MEHPDYREKQIAFLKRQIEADYVSYVFLKIAICNYVTMWFEIRYYIIPIT
jgi:hypothetical protein